MSTAYGPGIYAILNCCTGDYYIGSSTHIHTRWRAHRSQLESGKGAYAFQTAWNEYGADAFCFVVIENVPDKQIRFVEQMYLSQYQPAYNTNAGAYGWKLSEWWQEHSIYRHVNGHGHPCGFCQQPVGELEPVYCGPESLNAIPLHFDCLMEKLDIFEDDGDDEDWATFREQFRTPRPLIALPADLPPDAQIEPSREVVAS